MLAPWPESRAGSQLPKPKEADGLEEVHYHQHDRTFAVLRRPDRFKASQPARVILPLNLVAWRGRNASAVPFAHHLMGFLVAAFSSSQRADSGSFLRITQIISEQSAPKMITQRQPAGQAERVIGTSSHDISATAGTDKTE